LAHTWNLSTREATLPVSATKTGDLSYLGNTKPIRGEFHGSLIAVRSAPPHDTIASQGIM
jgi:hypothetical protein